MIICARTDARGVTGMADSIDRAKRYAETGVDMIFPEGMHNIEEFSEFAEALAPMRGDGGPFLLGNMTEFGVTDPISAGEFADIGYDCVIFPASTLRAAMGGVVRLLAELKETGQVAEAREAMLTRKETYEILGYDPGEEWVQPP